jgi:RNA polymerase sigma-70 factor (sigma-E family)
MTRAAAGPDGFAEFVHARYPALVRHGALLIGDPGRGEDLAQEALVKTYRAWHRLHPDGDPEAYTRRVMVRAAWRENRRPWRRETPAATVPEPPPADPYEQRETARLVLGALRALPASQRVVLVLRYWAGMSDQEIATMLGCPVGTVKSRLSRAASVLRRSDGPLAGLLSVDEIGELASGRARESCR